LRGEIHAQDDAMANQIAGVRGRHPENHFDAGLGFDPFAGAESHGTGAHVFGISHEPPAGPDSPEFHGQL